MQMANEMVKDNLSIADVQMIQKEKKATKTLPKDSIKGKTPVTQKTKEPAKGREGSGAVSASQSHAQPQGSSSAKSKLSSEEFNAEVAGILKELHNNQKNLVTDWKNCPLELILCMTILMM